MRVLFQNSGEGAPVGFIKKNYSKGIKIHGNIGGRCQIYQTIYMFNRFSSPSYPKMTIGMLGGY